MRIKITWIFCGLMLFLILFSASGWEDTASYAVGELLFVLAIIFVSISSIGRIWCSLYIAGKKGSTLVTEGPYSLCRNPLYFFSFLGAVGLGLATETCAIPVIVAVCFAVYYPFVIASEEKYLLSIHGSAYQEYLDTTQSFFPKFSAFSEPKSYSVDPQIFRRHCLSAVWFVLLLAIPETIEMLHTRHLLPVLFILY